MTLVISPATTPTSNNATPIMGDTILVYLIDRSGSMATCWEETIGGLNIDITEQQQHDDGKTEAAVYFFDGVGFMSRDRNAPKTSLVTPFSGPLSESIKFDMHDANYAPRGSTPLFDAVGELITKISDRVDATPTPVNVIVSIFTDGGNTDNHGWSSVDVARLIETKQGSGWTFTYFGANQDAWSMGQSFGIAAGNIVNYTTNNMHQTMRSASSARVMNTTLAKSAAAKGEMFTTSSYFANAGQTQADYD